MDKTPVVDAERRKGSAGVRRAIGSELLLRASARLVWRVLVDLADADAPGLAAELAYRAFLALIPSLLLVVAVFSFAAPLIGGRNVRIDLPIEVERNLPPDTAQFIVPYLHSLLRNSQGNVLSLSILLSLWTISGAITTSMKAAERVLKQPEHRSYLHRRLEAMALTAVLPALLAGSLALTWFGQAIRTALLGGIHEPPLLAAGLRYGLSLLLGCSATWVLLTFSAPRPLRRLALLAGTVTCVAGFWLASIVLAFYASRFAHYRSAYGLLGGALALLLWLYVGAFVLLFGMELIRLLSADPSGRRPP